METPKLHLEKELLTARRKFKSETAILEEVQAILAENEKARELISKALHTQNSAQDNILKLDLLEADKIFHLAQIKTICVAYRLRFLDSYLFKNPIPEEAISKIRMMETVHSTSLSGFKIIAPSKAFHLLNYDDPLLFVPLGNDYYYLIHQWGKEINTGRKLLVLPVKNLGTFTLFSILVSLLLTFIVPETKLSRTVPMASIIIFLFIFKSIFAVFAYYFFMMGKNFNSEIWKREYYNN